LADYSQDTDKALLEALAGDDEQAFAALYRRYHQKLFFFVLNMSGSHQAAEDALQEVFVKVWAERKGLPQVTNFNAYIYRMAKNHVLNALKRTAHETLILAEIGKDMDQSTEDVLTLLSYKDVHSVLKSAIEELPAQQKLVFRLSREEGLKHDEIARQLNISPLTVKKHVSQALLYLREKIRKHYALTTFIFFLTHYYHPAFQLSY
jgi:RNA polymerase sigma-70 factor (ECF subfamily)